jgi:hypothetical protein
MQDERIEVAPENDGVATELKCQYFFVGWTDHARTQIQGPKGRLKVMVGPTGKGPGNDFLRIFDEQEHEIESIEMGPRGSGAIASVDLHLNFDDQGMRWVIWNQNGVGANILERADKLFTQMAPKLLAMLL